jgi:glycosyltransferase involved in cell wall biosynthesis
MFKALIAPGRIKLVIVRRTVPQRLWANFEETARGVDLTVVETAPDLSDKDHHHGSEGFTLLKARATSVGEIHKILDDLQPQVLLCFGWADLCSLASLTWAKATGVPTIVSSDSKEDDYKRSFFKEFAKSKILGAFDLAWAAGSKSAEYLEGLDFPVERIHIGSLDTVDLSHFESGALSARAQGRALRAEMALPEKFFLSVARLSQEKNLDFLLQAFARYRANAGTEGWDLVLVGDGPLRAALEAQAASMGLEKYVQFRGSVNYIDLPVFYGLAQVFVLPSLRDTWAVVVNEAAAAHLPLLISTRAGSSEDLVRDGENGFCFDPSDLDGLAAKMALLSGGTWDLVEMGLRSREIVEGHGTVAYGKALTKLTERALSLPPRPFGRLATMVCRSQMISLQSTLPSGRSCS